VRRALLGACCLLAAVAPAAPAAADPAPRTPIRHVISLMQENHSFDNYFGTFPGADGISRRTCMPVRPNVLAGTCIRPFHLRNHSLEDLSDTPEIARAQLNGGRMNGFLRAIMQQRGRLRRSVMGHYDDRELPFYWNAAREYVLFDRFFGSALGGSLTNHMFWATGGPGDQDPRESVPEGGFDAPTIFDRLQAKGVSWKFYVQGYDPKVTFRSATRGRRSGQLVSVPPLNYARFVDDPKLFSHIVPLEQLSQDMARGTLPAVSYVVPLGSRERPPGSLAAGQAVVRTLVNGLMRSRYWKSSAFMVTYDSSGGFHDHVRPPRVDRWGYGFRVPALLISPYARRGRVVHSTLDFTSILKFIETNWRLRPLAARDRRAKGLMSAFAFRRGPREARFLTRERVAAPPPDHATVPVYVTYAAAAGVALLVIMLALLREGVLRRRAPHLRGPSARVRVRERSGR
jgi:phospholipase C